MRALQTLKFGQLPIEIIDGDRGKNYPKKSDFQTEGIPFLNSAAIHEGRIDFRLSNYITEDKYEMIKKGRVYKDDIILTTRGNGIGKVALFVTTKDYQEALINAQMLVVRTLTGKFDPDYLFYLIKSPIFQTQVTNFASGSAQPQLPIRDLKDIPVSVLKYQEQVLVGKTLREYDNLIENNNRRIAILEDMAQSLYREWFVHFRFPSHEKCQFKDSELGQIPEGWEVKKIKDFGEVITGKTPSKKNKEYYDKPEFSFIKTPDMHNGIFVLDTMDKLSIKGAESQKIKTLPVGSISVSCIGTAGVVSINATPAQTNQQINSIVLYEERDREYLYFSLLSLKQTIINYGSTGATMTNLSKGKFENLEVLYPTDVIVEEFSLLVKSIFKMVLNLMKKNNNLKNQRDMLLPKLISGKIEV